MGMRAGRWLAAAALLAAVSPRAQQGAADAAATGTREAVAVRMLEPGVCVRSCMRPPATGQQSSEPAPARGRRAGRGSLTCACHASGLQRGGPDVYRQV